MLQQNELHFMVQCTVCGTQFTYDPQTNECVETHAAKSESQLAFTEWKGSACSCRAWAKGIGIDELANFIKSTSCQFGISQLQSRGYNYKLGTSNLHIQVVGDIPLGNFQKTDMPALATIAPAWTDQIVHGDCLTTLRKMP